MGYMGAGHQNWTCLLSVHLPLPAGVDALSTRVGSEMGHRYSPSANFYPSDLRPPPPPWLPGIAGPARVVAVTYGTV